MLVIGGFTVLWRQTGRGSLLELCQFSCHSWTKMEMRWRQVKTRERKAKTIGRYRKIKRKKNEDGMRKSNTLWSSQHHSSTSVQVGEHYRPSHAPQHRKWSSDLPNHDMQSFSECRQWLYDYTSHVLTCYPWRWWEQWACLHCEKVFILMPHFSSIVRTRISVRLS